LRSGAGLHWLLQLSVVGSAAPVAQAIRGAARHTPALHASGSDVGALVSLAIGVGSAIVAVVCLQVLPTRYRWSKNIGWTQGRLTGQPIHRVWLGRRGPRIWRIQRGPFDVAIHARLVVAGLGRDPKTVRVVEIPVRHAWRAALGPGVLTVLFPQLCDPGELVGFPDDIIAKRRAGTLNLADLLDVGDAKLWMYAFGYRHYIGTRIKIHRTYTKEHLAPGRLRRGKLQRSEDGRPPLVADIRAPTSIKSDEPVWLSARFGSWEVRLGRRRQ